MKPPPLILDIFQPQPATHKVEQILERRQVFSEKGDIP